MSLGKSVEECRDANGIKPALAALESQLVNSASRGCLAKIPGAMLEMKTYTLLALAVASASGAILELPVHIQNTYASAEFQIGSPAKPYRLMLDTGSTSSWIVNSDCTDSSCLNSSGFNRTYYDASASSTSVDLDSFSRISYIDGDGVSGWATQDVFSDELNTIEWNQTFLSANESSWRFITADGFLGLGFSANAENKTSTFVETLLWADQLDAPRFSLFYGTNLGDDGAQDGVLSIGGSHEDVYVEGEVAYVPLRQESPYQLWRTALRSVNVLVARGSNTTNATVTVHNGQLPTTNDPADTYPKADTTWPMYGAGRAVFDTGAGRVSVPDEIIDAVYFNLGWNVTKLMNGEERMDCQHLNESWAISFTLGEGAEEDDVTFSLRGDEFVKPGDQCMPPVDNSGSNSFSLIGTAFLRRRYSVFDFGATEVADYQPRIGFGRLKEEYDYLSTTE